ncbi:MAG: DUF418 domain-containing protein [Pseudomonadota bacterium]
MNDAPVKAHGHSLRLDGLDVARYLALVGMVIVNFKIVMGVDETDGLAATLTSALEGRAAALFVVLAGVGLGLAARKGWAGTAIVTLRRAAFLLVVGLANMLVFDADIIHYYAFYFLFGAALLSLGSRALVAIILALNIAFVVMVLSLDYEAGWDFSDFSYEGFWTPVGFVRNLFFNGWHPVIPWLGFLVFGLILSRLDLAARPVQGSLIALGLVTVVAAEGTSAVLIAQFAQDDPVLAELLTTKPLPPMPLYSMAGMGCAAVIIGLCLVGAGVLRRSGVVAALAPAGRQTLTLYIAHIFIGMGALEELGLLGGQSLSAALMASAAFCALATVYAYVWSRRFKRGPVEAVMRRVAG